MKGSISIAIVLYFLFTPLFATDLLVPEDYPTIREAVDSAQSGDRILISSSADFGNIDVSVINLTFEGTGSSRVEVGADFFLIGRSHTFRNLDLGTNQTVLASSTTLTIENCRIPKILMNAGEMLEISDSEIGPAPIYETLDVSAVNRVRLVRTQVTDLTTSDVAHLSLDDVTFSSETKRTGGPSFSFLLLQNTEKTEIHDSEIHAKTIFQSGEVTIRNTTFTGVSGEPGTCDELPFSGICAVVMAPGAGQSAIQIDGDVRMLLINSNVVGGASGGLLGPCDCGQQAPDTRSGCGIEVLPQYTLRMRSLNSTILPGPAGAFPFQTAEEAICGNVQIVESDGMVVW